MVDKLCDKGFVCAKFGYNNTTLQPTLQSRKFVGVKEKKCLDFLILLSESLHRRALP